MILAEPHASASELYAQKLKATLMSGRPPWGGTYAELVRLYKDGSTECPFVMNTGDAPSCGSSSARFGCWTCTVVDKDKSLAAMIDAGHEHMEPLAAFRDRLKQVSGSPDHRSKVRRNGQPGLGPLNLDARRMLLEELLALQAETGQPLISDHEVRLIREQWEKDQTQEVLWNIAA